MLIGVYIWSFVSASIISFTVDDSIADVEHKKFTKITQKIIKKYKLDYEAIDRINKSLMIVKDSKLDEEFNYIKNYMSPGDSY